MVEGWRHKAEQRGTWRQCHRNPALVFSPAEMSFLSDVRGKDVCVLGSGDNEAVLALPGMGARVTSVDISEILAKTCSVLRAERQSYGQGFGIMMRPHLDIKHYAWHTPES